MKKTLSIILTTCLILSMLPVGMFSISAGAETYGDLTYTIVNDEAAITRCDTFATGSIHIPAELDGYPVTRIYGDAFINCTKVTHIYIPSTVVKIESGAFAWISNLQGVYVDENNQNYCADNGVLFNKDKTILLRAPRTLTEYIVPSSVIQIGSSAFNGCKNLNNVIIGDNVTSIGSSAFYECASLVSITIPDSVKTIEGSAFYRCTNLSDVEFGNSLTTIGEYAFNYCYALTSISLPDSVTDINRAFNQCTGLTSIDIGNVKTLDYRAFWGCSKLASITIGSNFTRVGSDAFEGCESLINVYYYGTEEQWQKVTISDGNFYLTERATVHYVHDCQWDEGTVTKEPSCVPGIKTYTCTWPGCGKTMTESIEKISDHKYGLWTSIDGENHQRTCTCGDVETGNHNWDKNICTEIRTCTNCGETSQGHIWTEATCNAPKTCIICNSTEGNPVHNVVGEVCSACGHYGTCGENLIWSLDDAGVLTIFGTGAMSDYNYNTIPWYSIKNSIKSIVLSDGVSSIGDNAFYECLELTSVSISATVTSIGEWAFDFCRSLTEINLPNGITTIDKYAFRYCMNIVKITLPDSVSTIGTGAFSYCIALESINIPDAVTAINQSTFADSRNLKNITIGKGVTKIWSSAFENCSSLESINIPTTVNMIQPSAFKGCGKLTTVIYCGTTTQWEAIQFIKSNSVLLGCERIQHSWIDATCVAPKTCAYCGVTDGDVIEHIYDNACDSTCNTCEKTRIPADHVYDNVCDTSCNICGAVRTVTHNYGAWIVVSPSTFTASGQRKRVCSVCEDTIVETTDQHVGKVSYWNIVLKEDYGVNFYLQVSESIESAAKVRLTIGNETATYNVSDLEITEDGYFKLAANISAAQMNDFITVMVINGREIGCNNTYTAREYCNEILDNPEHSAYHALVREMLNYGAMAQIYFDYDTEYLANDGITGVANAEVPETAEEMIINDKISGLNFFGASLVYRDRIAVRYYFTGDVTDCTFTANGNTYTPIAKDGMYYVEISDILPQDIEQQITLIVTHANGNEISVTYSPMNYIVRMNAKGGENLKNLLKALYNYHLAAKQLSETTA